MNAEQIKAAREALDNMDDYARMNTGVNAIGPRGVLERFISEVERTTSPVSQMTDEQIVDEQQKALNDMLIYGTGFTVGGKHAPIEKVMMFSNPEVTRAAPSKDDESGLPG